jgi:predicted transcriptional regulator
MKKMAIVTKGLSSMTVEDLCRKLRPVFGKQIDDLYMKYTLSSDLEMRQEIEKALNALYHKYLNESMLSEKILLEPPSEELIDGPYPIGTIMYADRELYPFHMRDKDWVRHLSVCGMSGSGKTNFAFIILGGFILKKKNFIVFDWKKSFRSLLYVDDKILCFPIGNENIKNFFRININRPPAGIGPKEWINILVDIISECYLTSFGVHKLLSETLDEAFNDFGVYKGSDNYPTWIQIKDRLEEKADEGGKKVSRETEWIASALRVAHSLTFGAFGEAITYKGTDLLTIEELLNSRVIFELDSLSNSEKKFFSEFILMYIYKLKKLKADFSTEEFKNAIIVDEAHNIFLKERPNFLKESVTEMIYREVREYGISLICLDQHISKLSDVVAGNSACNIAFQQMLPQDIDTVSSLMQLIPHRKYFSMLPVGYAIVKLAERYHEPFLIKIPFVELKKETMNDMEIGEAMRERTREFRQHKLFLEQVKPDNIMKDLSKLDNIFKSTGVEPTSALLKDQFHRLKSDEILRKTALELSMHMQKKQDDFQTEQNKVEPAYIPPLKGAIMNHIQKELVGMVREMIGQGYNLDVIKKHLLNQGYKNQDILAAINNITKNTSDVSLAKLIDKHKSIHQSTHTTKESDSPHQKEISAVQIAENKNSQTNALENDPDIEKLKFKILYYLSKEKPAVTELYKHFSLSARKGTRIKIELEDLGFIQVVEEKTLSGWKKKIILTDKGISFLRKSIK